MTKEENIYTEEDKLILLQDLCARLPHGVKVRIHNFYRDDFEDRTLTVDNIKSIIDTFTVAAIKPYLYPYDMMSSDPKLREEFSAMVRKEGLHFDNVTNFYNSHHIDYRDMIKKGLAIKITNENNPYKK